VALKTLHGISQVVKCPCEHQFTQYYAQLYQLTDFNAVGYGRDMKTNSRAWLVYRLRLGVVLFIVLGLAVVEFGLVFRFQRDCGQASTEIGPAGEILGLSDWLASR
jgi:hypothetical protein